jgi:hypothetical protein
MSFALEFRKKHFTAPTAKVAGRRKRSPSKRRKAEDGRAETRGARATMLGALVVAAAILAIFNSEGLRLYAGDWAESQFGRPLLAVSEAWDGAMQRAGAKSVEEHVRSFVTGLREARWTDLASAFGAAPVGARTIELKGETSTADEPSDRYTGALPRTAKHGLDDGADGVRPRFEHSASGVR